MNATPSPSGARRGRPPKGAEQLSRAAIVEATLKVIDVDGIASVSMRSVARVLGVDPKSLYNHVAGKDDLLDAVAEHLLGGIELPERSGAIDADLRAIAHAFRDRALLHPEAATLVLTRQLTSLDGLAPVEAVLGVLRAGGCPAAEAVRLLRVVVAAIVGTLLREVAAGPTFGTDDPEAVDARQQALEGAGLPHVAEAAEHLATFDKPAEFDFAVDMAVAAIVARSSDWRSA